MSGEPGTTAWILRVSDVVRESVEPVFARMLRPGECTRFSLDADALAGCVTLRALINGEEFTFCVAVEGPGREFAAQTKARLAVEVRDFIAQGGQTRGEERPIPQGWAHCPTR